MLEMAAPPVKSSIFYTILFLTYSNKLFKPFVLDIDLFDVIESQSLRSTNFIFCHAENASNVMKELPLLQWGIHQCPHLDQRRA